jgi:hypothetical protein
VGSNLIKVASTRATALKEKDDQVYCQPELLCEGTVHSVSSLPTSRVMEIFKETPRPLSIILPANAQTGNQEKRLLEHPAKSIWGPVSFR